MLKSEMTVVETQTARVEWRRGTHGDCRTLSSVSTPASRVDDFQDLVGTGGWTEFARNGISSTEFSTNLTVSTTQTCSPPPEANSVGVGEIPRKRKTNNNKEFKSKVGNVQLEAGKNREKRIKPNIEEEEESKITEQTETSKQNSKASEEVQKSDYVHVRARRGQATDSHSLAERARREKISERMKYLQNLVPGCNKIAGKAGMLDEIINYVQSLQQQVEFLSMKLATLNPRLDFINVDDLFSKQVLPTIEISPETANSYFNELGTVPQTPLMNSASITHFELCASWGEELQSLGAPLLSPSSFLSQQYPGIEDEKETFVDDKVVVPF